MSQRESLQFITVTQNCLDWVYDRLSQRFSSQAQRLLINLWWLSHRITPPWHQTPALFRLGWTAEFEQQRRRLELHLSASNLNATPLRGCLHLRSSLMHQLVAVSTPAQNLKGWDGGILASWWGLPWRWTARWKRDWGSSCGPWFQTSSSCQAAGRPSRRDQTCRPCPWRAALQPGWSPRWADRGAGSVKKTKSDEFLEKTTSRSKLVKVFRHVSLWNDAFRNHSIFFCHCGKL